MGMEENSVFQIGELNNQEPAFSPAPDMSQPDAFLDLLVGGVKKTTKSFLTSRGTLGWEAVCLRVAVSVPSHEDFMKEEMRQRSPNKGVFFAPSGGYVCIRAYIPDLHAGCPLPKTLPGFHEEHEDHDVINRFFPTDFCAPTDTLPVPMLGELIWVDYKNPAKLEGGIYNGRVNPKNPQFFYTNSGLIQSPKKAFNETKDPVSIMS